MVVILGLFYFGQDERLKDEAGVVHAVNAAADWLLKSHRRNVLVEINNEANVKYDHEILKPARVHELIELVKEKTANGQRLLVGTSFGGGRIPDKSTMLVSDFILMHGNGVSEPSRIGEMVRQVRAMKGFTPKPILFNEDDHFAFNKPDNNFTAAVAEHASWGFFDFRKKGEGLEEGYQSPPVNWGISSERKRGFFELLGKITGSK